MKNAFTNIILFLIMIFLAAAIGILGMTIYLNITETDTLDVIYTMNSTISNIEEETNNTSKPNIDIKQNSIDVEEIDTNNEIKERYFYEQLTNTQKKIYDGLQGNKEKMRNGTYKVQYGGIFTDILKQEGGDKILGQDYQSAVESFLYDNPDIFYIDANKLFLSVETTSSILKKTYNVYIGPADNDNYYVEGFTSEIQVNDAVKRIEKVKNNIVSKLTGNTYKDILKIHDYLVENLEYDKNYTSIGTYSVYGALIDKKCVCEGYAKALKYLLNAANIPCEVVQGTATSSSGKTENHAWNSVYLNGKWYYIDATWNDPIIIGEGSIAKSVQYRYFLKGSKTLNKDHVLSYKFSDGGRTYRYPVVEEYDYE